jgi:large subunit ribosomal protein L7/L12
MVEHLSNMKVTDIIELTKELEDKWGVSATAPVTLPGFPGDVDIQGDEQTEFDVILTSFNDKKMAVIKEIRTLTGLGLKESKELVEGCPKNIKEGISKEEAEEIKSKIESAGGSVEIK